MDKILRLLDGDLVTPFLKMSSVPRGSCWWQAPSPCEGLLRAYGGCTNQAPGIQVCVRDKSLLCVFLRGISLPDSSINKKMYACPRSARSLERHKRLWDVFRALPQGPMWTLLLPGPPGTLCDTALCCGLIPGVMDTSSHERKENLKTGGYVQVSAGVRGPSGAALWGAVS